MTVKALPSLSGFPLLSLAALFAGPAAAADPVGDAPAAPISSTVTGTVPARALNTGDIVTVTGASTPALYSLGTGAGGVGNGIVVNGGGGIQANNLAGTGLGVVTANNGGTINLGTGSIVRAQGSGSAAGIIGATGLFSRRQPAGSLVQAITARDLTVFASSDKPYAIYAHTDTQITLAGQTTISTSSNGTQGWGLVTNERGVITAENVTITMGGIGGVFGDFQAGISAWNGASTSVSGNAAIDITGKDSVGAYAQNALSKTTLNNISGSITANTLDASAFAANQGGSVQVNGRAALSVSGATEGIGAQVINNGTVNIAGSAQLDIRGTSAYGLRATDGGAITLNNGTLSMAGSGSAAAILSSASAAATVSTFNVSNSTFNSSGDGIVVNGGTANVRLSASTLNNNSQLAINVTGAVAGTLNLEADASAFNGRAAVTAGNTSNLTLRNGSRWAMTGNSVVTSLVNSASDISFSAPAGGVFKTLTTRNYSGTGGTISLYTQLGTDGSPSDRLVIDGGAATGNSFLRINNAGGTGALTSGNGILVVDAINAGTTAPNAFALGAPAVAGIYDYGLFRGSQDASAPQSWFLRSTRIRPETSLYAVLPALGILYGGKLLDTLDERWGEDTLWMGGGASGVGGGGNGDSVNALGSRNFPDGLWGRVIGQHGKREGLAHDVPGPGPRYDHDFYAMQAGMDVYRAEDADGRHRHGGLYGALGYGQGQVTHFDGSSAGKNSFYAYTLGGYWTAFSPTNAYLDGILQATWYDAKGDGRRGLPELKTRGMGYSLSLEGGYPFHLKNDWLVEPQAQLIYSRLNLDDTHDAGGSVSFHNGDSLIGRLGVRIGRSRTLDKTAGPRDSTGWVRLSVLREFKGQPQVAFEGPAGAVSFPVDLGGNWGEIKGGLTKQLNKGKFLYGTLGYQRSFDGKSYAYEAKLGLRVEW